MNRNISVKYHQRSTDEIINWTIEWKTKISPEKWQITNFNKKRHNSAYRLKYLTPNYNGKQRQNTCRSQCMVKQVMSL